MLVLTRPVKQLAVDVACERFVDVSPPTRRRARRRGWRSKAAPRPTTASIDVAASTGEPLHLVWDNTSSGFIHVVIDSDWEGDDLVCVLKDDGEHTISSADLNHVRLNTSHVYLMMHRYRLTSQAHADLGGNVLGIARWSHTITLDL
ncbi:MAG: hypothetical protein A2341_09215 [Deltaproteobacteria bacterium RIFOXYB12_FULL_58_9]|nr:MAG: hypothetical protein A2341_09215 [Deltaproteobacteria bacterium RIFOXYB12_FULL_58_9]